MRWRKASARRQPAAKARYFFKCTLLTSRNSRMMTGAKLIKETLSKA